MSVVTIITPPSPFLLDERVFPAIGILRVAAVMEQLGYTVEHLDLNGVENYGEAVLNHLARTESNIFAITATTPQMVAVSQIAKVIRDANPRIKTIIGGPHPTLVHAAAMKHSLRATQALFSLITTFNVVVAGDGEEAIGLALQPDAPHLIDADDPKTSLFLTSKRLAELPFPARHLIDMDSYRYAIDGVRVTPLIGQLGCPFGCNFCAGRDSAMLRRVRIRPVEHIIEEMRQIYNVYGIHGFMFFDDELNVNREIIDLLHGICGLQEELGVEFRCRGFVKSELFTEEQASAMYKAGFRRVMCGFESGSDRILKNINKRATKDQNSRAMEISHKYNLDMKALMSIGHPAESPETIEDTERWLLSVAPADFDVTIITAYPGSPYYDRATKERDNIWKFVTNGDALYMEDVDYTTVEDFYKGSIDAYKSYVFTDYISADELVQGRDHVERSVRGTLGIPFYQAGAGVRFEASMGQLPGVIYRSSNESEHRDVDKGQARDNGSGPTDST